MPNVTAIMLRDLRSTLSTFSFYLFLTFFLVMTGYFFMADLSYFSLLSYQAAASQSLEPPHLNLTEGVLAPFLLNMGAILLLLTPLFTMRSFAEERRSGTLELLVTYPVTDIEIVAGKFLAVLGTLACFIVPTFFYFLLAGVVGAEFEVPTLLSGYAGILLMSGSFVALGLFVSSLTDHQAVSAGIVFAVLMLFWAMGWLAEWANPLTAAVLREFSLIDHLVDLLRGVVDTKDIAYFALYAFFFLFATRAALEIRSWKR